VRVRVHVTLPEGTSREGEPINVQVQSVFSQPQNGSTRR
jgi:hypothetical protein